MTKISGRLQSRAGVGGVFSVVVWPAKESGRSDPPTSSDSEVEAVRVEIDTAKSTYRELVSVDRGVVKVEHTLTLVTDAECDFWQREAMAEAVVSGCIAEVVLSGYGEVLLGWSRSLGYEQPLRLVRTTVESGDDMGSQCQKSWVFVAQSTEPKI